MIVLPRNTNQHQFCRLVTYHIYQNFATMLFLKKRGSTYQGFSTIVKIGGGRKSNSKREPKNSQSRNKITS